MRTEETALPEPDAVGDLVGELLSKGCEVGTGHEALSLGPDELIIIAEYADEEGRVAGLVLVDLPFACRSGSALVMMPPAAAEEAVASGQVDGDMLDCFREVANVLTRLVDTGDGAHVKLRALHQSGQLLPGEVRTLIRGHAVHRSDYHLTIEEYGRGRLALLRRATVEAAAA